jgi:hypothetical protein
MSYVLSSLTVLTGRKGGRRGAAGRPTWFFRSGTSEAFRSPLKQTRGLCGGLR